MGIKLLNLYPYYAQANGQADASNQIMIKLIKKKIEEQPSGIRRLMRHYVHTGWPAMDQLKRHLMNLCMAIMQSFLGRLN